MIQRTTPAVIALTLLGTAVLAQEASERPRKPPTPLKVQVVFTRFEGERKVASLPYTLSVNADDRSTKLRMGVQIPLLHVSKDAPGNVVYKTVGSNVDCHAETTADGRYKLMLILEQSSVASLGSTTPGAATGTSLPPALRTFNFEAGLVLRDGQTTQFTAAADPVSGEVLKVDVTLNVVR